ncbi:MAG: bifunctional 3-deoxy-7-phosphoheptulonate synthase/chorismate mutase type II [Verrucomicrobiota bacterium]|jgi:chorismate mutase|nr:bifunctional 3-deoxy-7-phosphoheptulonate synthase/chorismate mutase type II [Verrucomicrobiota bacterium]
MTSNPTPRRPLIIAGPCSAETEEQTLQTCIQLAATGLVDMLRAGVWKPRTQPGTFEGAGLKGLAWLAKAKSITGLPIAVEAACAKHVENALEFGVDMLWLGARTTVNPFSVQDVADAVRGTGTQVYLKNPMVPDVALWSGAVERMLQADVPSENLGLIHRGFSHTGTCEHRNAPMWHLIFDMRSRYPTLPMICDPSHICGTRDTLLSVSQQAADLSYDGLIIESHIHPDQAWSDARQQLRPMDLARLLSAIQWRENSTDTPAYARAMEQFRHQIDQMDEEIFSLLARRMDIAEKIGRIKQENNVAVLQGSRWSQIVNNILSRAPALRLSEEFLRTVLNAIHQESIQRQNAILNSTIPHHIP